MTKTGLFYKLSECPALISSLQVLDHDKRGLFLIACANNSAQVVKMLLDCDEVRIPSAYAMSWVHCAAITGNAVTQQAQAEGG
jgi:hypothetical protein